MTEDNPPMALEANMTKNQQQNAVLDANRTYQQPCPALDINTRHNQQNNSPVVIIKVIPATENNIKENEQKQGSKSVNFKQN